MIVPLNACTLNSLPELESQSTVVAWCAMTLPSQSTQQQQFNHNLHFIVELSFFLQHTVQTEKEPLTVATRIHGVVSQY